MIRKGKKQFIALLMSAALIGTNISFAYAAEATGAKAAADDTAVQAAANTGDTGTESPAAESNTENSAAENPAAESSGSDAGQEPAQIPSAPETSAPETSAPEASAPETSGAGTPTTSAPETTSPDTANTSKDTETGTKTEISAPGTTAPTDEAGNNSDANTTGTDSPASADGQDTKQDAEGETNQTPDTAGTGTTAPDTAVSEQQTPDTADKETQTPDTAEETPAGSGAADGEATVPDDIAASENSSEGSFINKNGEEINPSNLIGVDYSTIADGYDGETNVIKQYAVSDSQDANTIMDSYLDENGHLIMVISQGSPAAETEEEEQEPASFFGSSSAPSIDGNFTGWDDVPASYEYNWDNSANCWQYGNWVTDPETGEQICYKTEEGTYDSNVRHEMQLYTDNENVYLKIKYATIYGSHANGEDFNFYVDGAGAKYQITWADGTPITGTSTAAGTYVVDVRNGDSSSSYSIVDGASAYYHVTENGINNELELKIPLSALQAQNGSVNLDNFSMIQFFTPNLMYNKISAAGSPTGAEPFAATVFLLIPASYVWLKKKNEAERAFA